MELDPDIADAVRMLQSAGIATYESCQGGKGHMVGTDGLPEPFVSFRGNRAEGFSALALFLGHPQYEVAELRRVWRVIDGEPEGPTWKLVFRPIDQPGQAGHNART
jgi:hypothetical protein